MIEESVRPANAAEQEMAVERTEPEPPGAPVPVAGEVAPDEAHPDPHGSRGPLSKLAERLSRELAQLREWVEDRFALDRFREEQIDRLHQELQTYKQDLLARVQRPLLMGLIRIHNDLGRSVAAVRGRPLEEQTPERFLGLLAGLEDDLELLLEQHGVERFATSEPEFDPTRQTALRTVETADAGLVGRVADRLRPGFSQGPALLQREGVAVYAASGGPERTAAPAGSVAEPEPGGDLE